MRIDLSLRQVQFIRATLDNYAEMNPESPFAKIAYSVSLACKNAILADGMEEFSQLAEKPLDNQ